MEPIKETTASKVTDMKMTINLSGYYETYDDNGADNELFCWCGEEKSEEPNKFKGIYKGDIQNGKANGKGVWEYEGDDYIEEILYCGDFKEGKFHGEGSLSICGNEGNIDYKGEFKDGKYNGKGFLDIYDGHTTYEGDFLDGEFHGKGEYIYGIGEGRGDYGEGVYEMYSNNDDHYEFCEEPNEMEYKGEFKNGKKDGEGYMKYITEFDRSSDTGFATTRGTWKENARKKRRKKNASFFSFAGPLGMNIYCMYLLW